jgi:prepilin-type N-terminal cleavage/methylation domain-containing protein
MATRWPVQLEQSSYSGRMATKRSGFTMIEVLIVVGIIAVLAGLLIPAVGLMRTKARVTETKQTLRELQTAFDLYRNEDRKRLYPTVAADLSIGTALMDHLEHQRMWARGFRKVDGQGRLLDPWQGWVRYSLVKPAPATGSPALAAWNWDAALGRERAYGSRLDPAHPGVHSTGPLPYAYLWSLGRTGRTDDAGDWLLGEDGR